MEKMDNFYNLLDIPYSATKKQIVMGYQNKISKYNVFKKVSSEQIKEIKQLKSAIYILTNDILRKNYDILLKKKSSSDNILPSISSNITSNEQEPVAGNLDNEDTFDSVFSIDNSWMKNNTDTNNKKDRVASNLMGERVFSLPNYNKKQNYSSEMDAKLRKPLQCRDDKTKIEE